MSKHRSGGKFTGSHTTVTDDAALVVDAASRHPDVTKIVLGAIENGVKSKQKRLSFKEVPAGWEVKVHGNISLQTVYVYTANRDDVRGALIRALH